MKRSAKLLLFSSLIGSLLQQILATCGSRLEPCSHASQSMVDGIFHWLPGSALSFSCTDPQGRVLWTYNKAHPVPGLEHIAPGDGNVPVVDTPYGRLATVICFDADFPNLIHQAGSKGVDIMLVPALDWPGIDPWHTENATFRAIEDGYSLVRQTSNGLAMTVDYEGHVLAATDSFTTNQQTMIASVPVQGVWTIYAHVRDLFVWLCIAGLVLLMGFVAFTSGVLRGGCCQSSLK